MDFTLTELSYKKGLTLESELTPHHKAQVTAFIHSFIHTGKPTRVDWVDFDKLYSKVALMARLHCEYTFLVIVFLCSLGSLHPNGRESSSLEQLHFDERSYTCGAGSICGPSGSRQRLQINLDDSDKYFCSVFKGKI